MEVGRNWFGVRQFQTTFVCHLEDATHHIHFSIAARPESNLEKRIVAFTVHPINGCTGRYFSGRQSNDLRYMTQLGLPVEEIYDWNETDMSEIYSAFCPETLQQYQYRVEEEQRHQILMQQYDEQVRNDLSFSEHETKEEDEDFPFEFDSGNQCTTCLEDNFENENYLCVLPCGHGVCKSCLKKLHADMRCPVCRKNIDKAFVRRKKM